LGAGCAFALELLVDAVDGEEVLAAEGFVGGGGVGGVDVEAFGDAVGGDFDAVGVFGLEGAVFEGGGEEVDDGQREALAGVGGLGGVLVWVAPMAGAYCRTIAGGSAWCRRCGGLENSSCMRVDWDCWSRWLSGRSYQEFVSDMCHYSRSNL